MTDLVMNKKVNKQMLGFMLSGLVSTGLMYGLYLIFHRFTSYQQAYFFSYILSVFALYFMNLWVFKASISLHSLLKFPFIYALQYLIGAGTLEFLVHIGISSLLAPILIIVVLFPITFILNKLVF
jgi:putative flippase GtrA